MWYKTTVTDSSDYKAFAPAYSDVIIAKTAPTYAPVLTDNPTYTNAGEYTVYFYIVSKNYEADPISGSKVVNIAKADATVKTAPEAVSDLIANGEYQELVTAGESEGGKLVYAIGDENGALEHYTELISAAADAGT